MADLGPKCGCCSFGCVCATHGTPRLCVNHRPANRDTPPAVEMAAMAVEQLAAALDLLEAWVTWHREMRAALPTSHPAFAEAMDATPPSPLERTNALLYDAGRTL